MRSSRAFKHTCMETSAIKGWTDFLIASGGTIGALVGLVFVSLSINLARIIERAGLAGRAAETIILLTGNLAGILIALFPRLSEAQLGVALAVPLVPTWLLPMLIHFGPFRRGPIYRLWQEIVRGLLHQAAALPGLLCVASLWGFLPGGMTWFAIGVIMSIVVAITNAWVLLVEILR